MGFYDVGIGVVVVVTKENIIKNKITLICCSNTCIPIVSIYLVFVFNVGVRVILQCYKRYVANSLVPSRVGVGWSRCMGLNFDTPQTITISC